MKAVWFRPDKFGPEFELSDTYSRLYRAARRAGYEIKSERSNITRGWTYNAPIYRADFIGIDSDGVHRHNYVPRGAGQGANPMEAMLDAMRLVGITGIDAAMARLEAEAWLLARAIRNLPKHNPIVGIAALTEDDGSDNVPPAETERPRPIPAKPDEDDDL